MPGDGCQSLVQREQLLAGGVAAVVVVMLLAATLVPGALADAERDDVRDSHLRLEEADSTIRVLSVPGDTVHLQLDSRIAHRGGPAENVSVEVRAIDEETGLLEDRREQSVGTVSGGRTVPITTNITVPRDGGYRIETIVYQDDRRSVKGTRRISGVGSLTPDYARSSVQFKRFRSRDGGFGSIETQVRSQNGERTTLNASAYLRNGGSDASETVRVRLRARQAESNLVADSTTATVDSIRPGVTDLVTADLSVPDGYNYWVDAILYSDGVVVDTASAPANLLPGQELDGNASSDGDGFSTGDFARETPREDDNTGATPTETPAEGPGFGPVAALAALAAAALLAHRRHDR